MNAFVEALAQRLAAATGLTPEAAAKLVETPKDPKLGDYSFPCFSLAKALKKAPPVIAKDVAAAVSAAPGTSALFSAIEAAGPYVNARLAPGAFARSVIDDVRSKGARFVSVLRPIRVILLTGPF